MGIHYAQADIALRLTDKPPDYLVGREAQREVVLGETSSYFEFA